MHPRGDRLAYSNGIIVLAVVAGGLIYAFDGSVTRLIQLYILGVFTSFTLSQAGMVRHWNRSLAVERDPAARRRIHRSRAINAGGAVLTALVLVVVLATKFSHGAYLVVIAVPDHRARAGVPVHAVAFDRDVPGNPAVTENLHIDAGNFDELVARARCLIRDGHRRILGITGAPAAGKSTLAARIVAALGSAAVLVPMDGFHLAEAELHRLGRHDRKGAMDTFDAAGFVCLLRRLREAGPATVYAPEFRRDIEESIAGAIPVPPDVPLVVTEGNYLLADQGEWAAIRDLLDEAWFVEVDEEARLSRLVARHVSYGRSPAEAAGRAYGSDQRNADFIATTRPRSDLVVTLAGR